LLVAGIAHQFAWESPTEPKTGSLMLSAGPRSHGPKWPVDQQLYIDGSGERHERLCFSARHNFLYVKCRDLCFIGLSVGGGAGRRRLSHPSWPDTVMQSGEPGRCASWCRCGLQAGATSTFAVRASWVPRGTELAKLRVEAGAHGGLQIVAQAQERL
jgi:hypothetical protein